MSLKLICLEAEEQPWSFALLGSSFREAAVGIGEDHNLAVDLQSTYACFLCGCLIFVGDVHQ